MKPHVLTEHAVFCTFVIEKRLIPFIQKAGPQPKSLKQQSAYESILYPIAKNLLTGYNMRCIVNYISN